MKLPAFQPIFVSFFALQLRFCTVSKCLCVFSHLIFNHLYYYLFITFSFYRQTKTNMPDNTQLLREILPNPNPPAPPMAPPVGAPAPPLTQELWLGNNNAGGTFFIPAPSGGVLPIASTMDQQRLSTTTASTDLQRFSLPTFTPTASIPPSAEQQQQQQQQLQQRFPPIPTHASNNVLPTATSDRPCVQSVNLVDTPPSVGEMYKNSLILMQNTTKHLAEINKSTFQTLSQCFQQMQTLYQGKN